MCESALSQISDLIARDSFYPFYDQLEDLFDGLLLSLNSTNIDVVIAATQIFINSLQEILKDEEVEKHFLLLIPTLIENLGCNKAVVRKSTHRCIASFVKLS